jgi:uncharacterized protein YacL
LRYFRIAFVLLTALAMGVLFGIYAPNILQWLYDLVRREPTSPDAYVYARAVTSVFPLAILGVILGAAVSTIILRIFERWGDRWDRMDIGDKVSLFLGIFLGLIASVPFLFLFNAIIGGVWLPVAVLGLIVLLTSLAVYMLQSMEEILPWTRGKNKGRRRGIKILDTNVIIDGRVYDVARSGFLEGQLYVPGFVLDELQYIADSHDPLKRNRGRRGLDVLRHLQADLPMEVRVHDKHAPDPSEEVDSRLVRLAKAIGGDIVTNDFNLNRVASLQDVRVLNINDLAMSLRTNVLPQETLSIAVIREGNQPGQGVGYLDDGTMVVVDNGKSHIGESLEVTVTQVIQTERGKMIFAELPHSDNGAMEQQAKRRTAPRRTP